MAQADKFHLCVGALTGKPYIAFVNKQGRMTDNRRTIPREEVLQFIHEWAQGESQRTNSNEIFVTADGETVLNIELLDVKK